MGWKYCPNDLVFNSKVDGMKPSNSVFNGWVKEDQPYTPGVPLIVVKANRRQIEYLRKLQFHSSWDWLMPVVEKLMNIPGCVVEMSNGNHGMHNGYVGITYKYKYGSTHYVVHEKPRVSHGQDFRTLIEAVYTSIVEFIEWYNTQK